MFHKIFPLLWFPLAEQLKFKYGVGQTTEDKICPKWGKKFQCY